MSRSRASTVPRTDDGAPGLSRKTPYLVQVLHSEAPLDPSTRHDLTNLQTVVIGRGQRRSAERLTDPGQTLRLHISDAKASRSHALLRQVSGRWMLEDAGSTNGTLLNGSRVERAVLKDGDVFEVGYTFFLYRVDQATVGSPPDVTDADTSRGVRGTSSFSPRLSADFDALVQLARAPVAVLIEGETGTGKELVARAIHELSARSGPFVAVNCGAVPESLFESELFGYRKGAFSAAFQDRLGLIREADKGTLFLDEMGDLPLATQVKLLRVLQEQEVLPLGATRPIPVELKLCAATNRRLQDLVDEKRFRDDLFARVSGFQLRLPPLRDRREDLGLLIRTVLRQLDADRAPNIRFTRAAAAALFQYHWPLNIRELETCLTTALTLAKEDLLGIEHFPEKVRASAELIPRPGRLPALSGEDGPPVQIREKLNALLMSHQGNISAIARALGRDRVQVRRWLRKLKLDPARFRRS